MKQDSAEAQVDKSSDQISASLPLKMMMASLENQALRSKIDALEAGLDKRIKSILEEQLEEYVHDKMLGTLGRELKESLAESVSDEIKETLNGYFSNA